MAEEPPLPKGVRRRRERSEIIAYIEGLPDDADVKTGEAAIYLDISSKTLRRWSAGYDRKLAARLKKNVGEKGDVVHVNPVPNAPKPIKHVAKGSKATNQHLRWRVGDLKRFKREVWGSATDGVATFSFAGRMDMLTQERPWFAADGIIVGEATSAPKNIFDAWKRRDGSVELLSLSIIEAMCDYDWQDADARSPWDSFFRDELGAFAADAGAASAARQQSMKFRAVSAKPGRRKPPRSRS